MNFKFTSLPHYLKCNWSCTQDMFHDVSSIVYKHSMGINCPGKLVVTVCIVGDDDVVLQTFVLNVWSL